jgi:hypothetical protein
VKTISIDDVNGQTFIGVVDDYSIGEKYRQFITNDLKIFFHRPKIYVDTVFNFVKSWRNEALQRSFNVWSCWLSGSHVEINRGF